MLPDLPQHVVVQRGGVVEEEHQQHDEVLQQHYDAGDLPPEADLHQSPMSQHIGPSQYSRLFHTTTRQDRKIRE